MDGRDPRCVHVEYNMALANFVATWLATQGIPAQVMNEELLGGFEGLVSVSGNLGDRGVEVWVDDLADADRARQLLADKAADLKATRATTTGPVIAVCGDCGTQTTFPADAQGTVQECPQCAAYIDVPGADDDWGDEEIEAAVESE